MSRATRGLRTIQDGTVIPAAGTEPEQTPVTPLRFVAHLGDDFHRGNVIVTKKKHSTTFRPIAREAADRLARGRRGQRNGLVYHAGYEGFDPESWQVVVKANESVRLELAPLVDGAPPTIVDIQRSPATTDAELFDITTFAIEEHELVRKDDGVGGMVGIGDHLAYDGQMHPFVMKNEQKRGLWRISCTLRARSLPSIFLAVVSAGKRCSSSRRSDGRSRRRRGPSAGTPRRT